MVQSEIGDDAPTALQAVKLLATYRSHKEMRDTVKANLTSWLADSETGNNPTLQLVAGIIYMEEGDLEEAAKVPLNTPAEKRDAMHTHSSAPKSSTRPDQTRQQNNTKHSTQYTIHNTHCSENCYPLHVRIIIPRYTIHNTTIISRSCRCPPPSPVFHDTPIVPMLSSGRKIECLESSGCAQRNYIGDGVALGSDLPEDGEGGRS